MEVKLFKFSFYKIIILISLKNSKLSYYFFRCFLISKTLSFIENKIAKNSDQNLTAKKTNGYNKIAHKKYKIHCAQYPKVDHLYNHQTNTKT